MLDLNRLFILVSIRHELKCLRSKRRLIQCITRTMHSVRTLYFVQIMKCQTYLYASELLLRHSNNHASEYYCDHRFRIMNEKNRPFWMKRANINENIKNVKKMLISICKQEHFYGACLACIERINIALLKSHNNVDLSSKSWKYQFAIIRGRWNQNLELMGLWVVC